MGVSTYRIFSLAPSAERGEGPEGAATLRIERPDSVPFVIHIPTTIMSETTTTPSAVRSDVEINGSITFKGELSFGGQLTGGGIKGPILTVSPGASVSGNIESDAFTLHGTVKGDVTVGGKCDLSPSAQLYGNLTTARLVMGEGATFVGRAHIKPSKKDPVADEPAAA